MTEDTKAIYSGHVRARARAPYSTARACGVMFSERRLGVNWLKMLTIGGVGEECPITLAHVSTSNGRTYSHQNVSLLTGGAGATRGVKVRAASAEAAAAFVGGRRVSCTPAIVAIVPRSPMAPSAAPLAFSM